MTDYFTDKLGVVDMMGHLWITCKLKNFGTWLHHVKCPVSLQSSDKGTFVIYVKVLLVLRNRYTDSWAVVSTNYCGALEGL